jgi:hypothetical protein
LFLSFFLLLVWLSRGYWWCSSSSLFLFYARVKSNGSSSSRLGRRRRRLFFSDSFFFPYFIYSLEFVFKNRRRRRREKKIGKIKTKNALSLFSRGLILSSLSLSLNQKRHARSSAARHGTHSALHARKQAHAFCLNERIRQLAASNKEETTAAAAQVVYFILNVPFSAPSKSDQIRCDRILFFFCIIIIYLSRLSLLLAVCCELGHALYLPFIALSIAPSTQVSCDTSLSFSLLCSRVSSDFTEALNSFNAPFFVSL